MTRRRQILGESYPEDVTEFYSSLFQALDAYLKELGVGKCRFDFELIYFNSSSAKAIMTILEKLDSAAVRGASVDIYWIYDEDDDNMAELGEEFGEDLESARFHLKQKSSNSL